jgi:tryptophanyl-tRNA synthetase
MNLKDASKKMSKSDTSDLSRINISDEPEVIMNKILKAKTDSIIELRYDEKFRPEVSNLMKIYSNVNNVSINEIEKKYNNKSILDFKMALGESLAKL